MSEAISTGSVMSAVNVSVMEEKEVKVKNPQPGDGVSEKEHKHEIKEIIEAEVGTDDDDDDDDGSAILKVSEKGDTDAEKEDLNALAQCTGSQPQDAVVLPSAQPLMADMPVDKPSPSDIKRNLTPREARQLVELQYHEQLRQYQRWLLALAEAVRERRRAEEAPHAQQTNEVVAKPSSATKDEATERSGDPAVHDDEKVAKKRKVDAGREDGLRPDSREEAS
ncbi:hypothetical protein Pmar_PMAR026514 [Perkinsus marinus ATCC 50983]|uniref:Uncharacterized protein n=1 Tax=Perkinsus marinus (strain ATCC 50983 / TXsc) TaxID=423536 RepID=C5LDR6_PERM5|nr:hypothetical protein Pmar_PMAR026514 [Perkinsus marinus ATCC 50983]EER05080.1 hypothetical protein Pmar_PMAR026514 [Perkinsus marinus ATCC 50983]|eukprot:XP_002773264.1 hypothetical protein Pmar_PMAR026514 [Perkinsus marinus ATCC 50983]